MQVVVHSRAPAGAVVDALRAAGMAFARGWPGLVVCYGGDGTILEAEARFPGVPKLAVVTHPVRARCPAYRLPQLPRALAALQAGRYALERHRKVEALAKGQRLAGVNEIQLRNADPAQALRFALRWPRGGAPELRGDGIVVATPYGSTGYYRALGNPPFREGFRVGFNNVFPRRRAIPLQGVLRIRILRTDALLLADNQALRLRLHPGDQALIRGSRDEASFVRILPARE